MTGRQENDGRVNQTETFRDLLDVARERRNWSIQRLAQEAGFSSPQHLHRKMTGIVRWQPQEIAWICWALGLDPLIGAKVLWPELFEKKPPRWWLEQHGEKDRTPPPVDA